MRSHTKVFIAIIALIAVLGTLGAVMGGTTNEPASKKASTDYVEPTAVPDLTPAPTVVRTPSPVPVVSQTPLPTAIPTPPPQPILISGFGKFATNEVSVTFPIAVLEMYHGGSGHFSVKAFSDNGQELLANEVGGFEGRAWLAAEDYIFDISANGYWSISIEPITTDLRLATHGFSGIGQDVSPIFNPPSRKVWEFFHRGTGHFSIVAVCAGGRTLIANEIGAVSSSTVVEFDQGPCIFDVSADGEFGIKPR